MTIVVTGATGFIGNHLVRALRGRNRPVRAVVRSVTKASLLPADVETVVAGDIGAPMEWKPILEGADGVVHLAGQAHVLRATLPAGTVSGAPKVRAMEIIDNLEPLKRGPYAGVVGYLDFSGNLDTAIAIRTMVVQPDGRASVQAGAGIVVDSVPEHEDLECRNKAQALLAAVPAARRMTAARRSRV